MKREMKIAAAKELVRFEAEMRRRVEAGEVRSADIVWRPLERCPGCGESVIRFSYQVGGREKWLDNLSPGREPGEYAWSHVAAEHRCEVVVCA